MTDTASEMLLKSCGKPLAIILILRKSEIGSLQTNWHPSTSPSTWICRISMLHVALLQLMVEHKENLCKNPDGGTVEDKRFSGSVSVLLTQTDVGLETWSWGQSCIAIGETKTKPCGKVSLCLKVQRPTEVWTTHFSCMIECKMSLLCLVQSYLNI